MSGTPPPEFTWLKDGVVLSDVDGDRVTISSNVLDRESQLEIASVIPVDSGAYTCIATNPAGEARRVTGVEINCECPSRDRQCYVLCLEALYSVMYLQEKLCLQPQRY